MVQHREDGSALCCHPRGDAPTTARWQTRLTIGLELDGGRLVLQDGTPCRADPEGWIRV